MPWDARGGGGHLWRWVSVGVVVAAVVGLGLYYLFTYTPVGSVTVTGGTVTLIQGTDAEGGWLGPSTVQ